MLYGTYFKYSTSEVKVIQSTSTLCDPMDCGLPGSSVHGILQARKMEWVAISSFRESSKPRDWTWVSYLLYQQAGSLPQVPHMPKLMASIMCLFIHNAMNTSGNKTLEMWIVPLDGAFNGPHSKYLSLDHILSTLLVHSFNTCRRDISTWT